MYPDLILRKFAVDPDLRIHLAVLDPDLYWECVSGSRSMEIDKIYK